MKITTTNFSTTLAPENDTCKIGETCSAFNNLGQIAFLNNSFFDEIRI